MTLLLCGKGGVEVVVGVMTVASWFASTADAINLPSGG